MPTAPKTFRPKHAVAPMKRVDPFYQTAAWRSLRKLVLAEEPCCRECDRAGRAEPTRQIDHIVPRSKRPDLELVRENLQGLCHGCHNAKTARE